MKVKSELYHTLLVVLSQVEKWLDKRHMKTLAWMVIGLIESEQISLTRWIPYAEVRAQIAQSVQRRFQRWLENERIEVHSLYGPLLQQALQEWGMSTLYLALDTSLLWGRYCIIRVSLVYRGRAIPIVWQVLEHGSSSVAFAVYKPLLTQVADLLPLSGVGKIILLADRGFADTALMSYVQHELDWHWRIRIKSCFKVYRRGQAVSTIARCAPPVGQAYFWHTLRITDERYGPVHLALAHLRETGERWYVLSDEPTSLQTFDEYGLRFDIEENFLDDKSNGFQLEASLIRSPQALTRLCLVLAVATLFLVCQGVDVVRTDRRRWVDPHWFRGNSYLRIGWSWVKHAQTKAWPLLTCWRLDPTPDPEPAIASRASFFALPALRLAISFQNFA
jgi:hypothetical protein